VLFALFSVGCSLASPLLVFTRLHPDRPEALLHRPQIQRKLVISRSCCYGWYCTPSQDRYLLVISRRRFRLALPFREATRRCLVSTFLIVTRNFRDAI
jgi:hypothetical protein